MIAVLRRRLRDAAHDRGGNVSILVAFAALPLLGMTGLAADYSMMLSTKSKLDQAADAAALAGVTRTKAYIQSYTGTDDPTQAAIAAGQAQAQSQFNANTGSIPAGSLTIRSMSVTRSQQTLTGNVSYSYQMPTYFMSMLGTRTMSVAGSSTTTLTMSTYVNVYVVIDNSASMGIGATAADQQTVYTATGGSNGGCALTCHYAGQGQSDTVVQAHKAGAQLRIDAAKAAVYAGLQSILNLQNPTKPTYNVAVYTASNKLVQVFPSGGGSPSTDIQSAMNAVGKDSSSGIDITSTNGDGGTDTTNALNSLAAKLPTAGAGITAATAQGVVIFVTDGVQDQDSKVWNSRSKTYVDQANGNFTPFNPCQPSSCTYNQAFGLYFQAFDPSQCSPIKQAGYTVMTLNVQYLIPDISLQGGNQNLQDVFTYIQNYLSTSIPGNLSSCATSASYAYSAKTPDEIASATKRMFGAIPAVALARISQ